MKKGIKLLTQQCCSNLLAFASDPELRNAYNRDSFDDGRLEFLKSNPYAVDEAVKFGFDPSDDCQSSISLFKELEDLDLVQANDKRLWTSLTHTLFYEYTRKRWKIGPESSDQTIIRRFHFEGNGIEARMRNSVSRLWWTAKVTYDSGRKEPFELTRLIWERQDIHVALMERSLGTYPNLIRTFLEFYKKNRQLAENDIRMILRGINATGGVKQIPLLDDNAVLAEIRRVADYAGIKVNA